MKKRILAMLLVVAFVFGMSGCQRSYDEEYSEYIDVPGYSEEAQGDKTEDDSQDTTSDDKNTNSNANSNSGGGNKNTGTNNNNNTNNNSKKGKALDDDLDFGGKTVTKTIIGTISPAIQRRAAAFEKAYNCKFKFVKLKWENYNTSVASSIASGKPYDICGLAPHFYPEAVVSNLYEPLDGYFSEVDLYGNPANKNGEGLDLQVMETYRYNGKYYGASDHVSFSSQPFVFLYNKKLMAAAGYTGKNDPLQMYKDKKWTWDSFEKMANDIQKRINGKSLTGKYVLGGSMYPARQYMVYSNDVSLTKVSGGKVVGNLQDKKFLTALTRINKWFKASSPFIDVEKGYSDSLAEFINGTYYMEPTGLSSGPIYVMPQIKNGKGAFTGIKDLGVVPFPVGPDNTKRVVASGGVYSKATAKGGDRIACLAWVKFAAKFDDPMKKEDPYQYSAEVQAEIDKWYDNLIMPVANYKSSGSATAEALLDGILSEASNSDNYAKAISDNIDLFQNCIDTSLKQKK